MEFHEKIALVLISGGILIVQKGGESKRLRKKRLTIVYQRNIL